MSGSRPNLFKTDKEIDTKMFAAVRTGNLKFVEAHRSHLSSINCDTLLHEAAEHGQDEIMKLLVEYGADINSVNGKHGKDTPLHVAVKNKKLGAVKFLIEQNADTTILDYKDRTALSYSAYQTYEDLFYYGFEQQDSFYRFYTCTVS